MADAGIETPDKRRLSKPARKAALNAARARAHGHSREQARKIYIAELQARGLRVPPEAVLDGIAQGMTASRVEVVLQLGRALTDMGKMLHGLYQQRRPR